MLAVSVKLVDVSDNDDSSIFVPVILPESVEFVKLRVKPVPVPPLVNVPTVTILPVPAQDESAVFSTLFSESIVLTVETERTSGLPVPAVSRPRKLSVAISAILSRENGIRIYCQPCIKLPETSPAAFGASATLTYTGSRVVV